MFFLQIVPFALNKKQFVKQDISFQDRDSSHEREQGGH